MKKFTSDEQLKEAVKQSLSWREVIRKCNGKPGGGTYQYVQFRVKKLNFDTSHFLGQSAHAGKRHTGRSKKLSWSDILIYRKTKDREKSGKIRRAFKEYCHEKNISIQCVGCNNKGEWFGHPMILEINHIDKCRWNNVPNNLEWICPNCHSIK